MQAYFVLYLCAFVVLSSACRPPVVRLSSACTRFPTTISPPSKKPIPTRRDRLPPYVHKRHGLLYACEAPTSPRGRPITWTGVGRKRSKLYCSTTATPGLLSAGIWGPLGLHVGVRKNGRNAEQQRKTENFTLTRRNLVPVSASE